MITLNTAKKILLEKYNLVNHVDYECLSVLQPHNNEDGINSLVSFILLDYRSELSKNKLNHPLFLRHYIVARKNCESITIPHILLSLSNRNVINLKIIDTKISNKVLNKILNNEKFKQYKEYVISYIKHIENKIIKSVFCNAYYNISLEQNDMVKVLMLRISHKPNNKYTANVTNFSENMYSFLYHYLHEYCHVLNRNEIHELFYKNKCLNPEKVNYFITKKI